MSSPSVCLCLNSGSSSLKYAVIEVGNERESTLAQGAIDDIGDDHAAALEQVFARLANERVADLTVVGHRIVHGGPEHVAPAVVDDALVASLRTIIPLAPLHMPSAIAGIEAVRTRHPKLVQIACFDTAFHASMPEVAYRLPIPDRFADAGIRRYGFHGLSYEYVMSVLGASRPARIVIAHLGNGSSLVAVRDGRAIDTTMGLTPTGGVIMGSRSGDLDPGVLVYLAREHGLSADALEHLVDRESGLVALGGTSDMVTLLARAATDPRARLAIEMFGYSIRKAIGALAAALGGIDLLVFTGGIGEHAEEIRSEACRGLDAFGGCPVRVIPTNEDLVIARHARRLTCKR